MVISAGKMPGLWSGQPNTIKPAELLLPEPETAPQPGPTDGERPAAATFPRPVTPRPRGGKVAAAPVSCLHCASSQAALYSS
jgi:hypothetical protein